ncbi:hypothetical protein C7S14_1155 [Burkholderia cepacia]|nr:hypothetical protein C7S14_1155 [Burkholderia cepacia]
MCCHVCRKRATPRMGDPSLRRAGTSAEPMPARVCGHSGAGVRGRLFVNNLLPECRRQGCGTGAILRRKLIEMNWSAVRHNAGFDVDRFRSSYRADLR